METDRNVLFAVLALRAGLIDADQFATACDRWAARRDRPLADLLLQLGLLGPEDRPHVDYLLDRHTQKHAGNSQAALAELADAGVRSAFGGIRDAPLREWLTAVLPGGLWLDPEARRWRGWGGWVIAGAAVVLLLVAGGAGVLVTGVMFSRERAMMMEAQARAAEAQARLQYEQAEAGLQQHREELTQTLLQIAATPDDGQSHDRLLEQLQETYRERLRKSPNDMNVRRAAAEAFEQVGEQRRRAGRLAAAEDSYRQAQKLYEELTSRQPGMSPYRRDLARCQARLGAVLREVGKTQEAEAVLRAAVGLLQQLHQQLLRNAASTDPTVHQYQYDLAVALNQLAGLFRETNRLTESEQSYAQAVALLDPLTQNPSAKAEHRLELARSQLGLSLLRQTAGQVAASEGALRLAVGLLEKLVAEQPKTAAYRKELASAYDALAGVLRATERAAEAEALGQKAKALREKKE